MADAKKTEAAKPVKAAGDDPADEKKGKVMYRGADGKLTDQPPA